MCSPNSGIAPDTPLATCGAGAADIIADAGPSAKVHARVRSLLPCSHFPETKSLPSLDDS
jgi:hypothetical protein